MARTYGLGGGGLAGAGMQQQRQAAQMLGKAADEEQVRNITNEKIERERQAGNTQLGASTGAMVGSYFGPVGTVVGGLLGGVAGGLF